MNFEGKIAVITGANKGIGRATTDTIIKNGGTVVAIGRNENELKEMQDTYAEKISVFQCDVSDEEEVNKVVDSAISKYGRIDILVNNAGIFSVDTAPFVEQESYMWKKKIDINIYGTLYMTHAVLPYMMERREGRIINIGSVAGIYGIRQLVDYSMTKGAVIAFTAGLAREVGPYNITVNTVSPGNINTRGELPELSYLDRSGTCQECANVIAFLASDEASFVSGANYVVDGCRKKI